MPIERVTTRSNGVTDERIVEREPATTTYVDRGGGPGVGAVIVGVAVLALVAIVAFFLLSANRNDEMRTDAVTSAASQVANSANTAAQSASDAANQAAGSASRAAGAAERSVSTAAPSDTAPADAAPADNGPPPPPVNPR